jgi:hypothetical protein
MKHIARIPYSILAAAMLAGCTTSSDKPPVESFLTEREQKLILAQARPPQHYGFSAFPIDDGIGFRGAARLHPNQMATRDLQKGNMPVVEIRGRSPRNKMNVLLDTSSPHSWLEYANAEALGAIFLGMDDVVIPYRGGYNTGGINAYGGVVTQLRIDQLFMENIPFYIRMAAGSLGPLARGIISPPVDAILGYDNLAQFEYIQFDPMNGKVGFSATIPYVPHDSLVMTEAKIVNQRNYGLAVEGAIFGKPTPIILDFGGDYHLARGDARVSSTKQVSIGDVVYRQVPTLLLPINSSPPRAGRKMLEKYVITICPRLGVVYFERIPE